MTARAAMALVGRRAQGVDSMMTWILYKCEWCSAVKRVLDGPNEHYGLGHSQTEFIRCACSENKFTPHQKLPRAQELTA